MNEAFNPYAPPLSADLSAPVADVELPLASRKRRALASILDSLIPSLILLPFQYYFGTVQREWQRQAAGGSMFAMRTELILWAVPYTLILIAINWSFLANGQTIFKKILNLRVDRMEGGPCDRTRYITRRIVLVQILYGLPVTKYISMIVDGLMIFRRNKRTLHDEFAGTKVVYLGK